MGAETGSMGRQCIRDRPAKVGPSSEPPTEAISSWIVGPNGPDLNGITEKKIE